MKFHIGGSIVLKQSNNDLLTIAATGVTVAEAMKASDELAKENIKVRVVDCYSIKPVDKSGLLQSVDETELPIVISAEDHFAHGGLGDFIQTALQGTNAVVVKLAVQHIPHSGKMMELLRDAEIDAAAIVSAVKAHMKSYPDGH